MLDPHNIGKLLISVGLIIVIAGLVFFIFGKIPFLGKLPGDIIIKKEKFTLYFPLATSLLISLILTIIFYFLKK